MKPLLLLDIDGVLCPYDTNRTDLEPVIGHGYAQYDPANIEDLRRLSEVFDLVWASFWQESANSLCSTYDLPRLDHIPFTSGAILSYHDWLNAKGEVTLKLGAVREYVGNRPAAWIDDDLWPDTVVWAYERNKTIPTKLFPTYPHLGMTPEIVEDMLRWGSQL